jgi:hypothetical protein
LSEQRFSLANDLAPGASVSMTITVTAPASSGSLVLEYQMLKDRQFWFSQFADVGVSLAAATWAASYTVTATPPNWAVNQTQSYSVTVTNSGNQTWPAGGTTPVVLDVHFASVGGGYGTSGTGVGSGWLSEQRFSLANDLAPGASVSMTITVTAPASSGSLVLEYQMLKDRQFWFSQFADVNVTVA